MQEERKLPEPPRRPIPSYQQTVTFNSTPQTIGSTLPESDESPPRRNSNYGYTSRSRERSRSPQSRRSRTPERINRSRSLGHERRRSPSPCHHRSPSSRMPTRTIFNYDYDRYTNTSSEEDTRPHKDQVAIYTKRKLEEFQEKRDTSKRKSETPNKRSKTTEPTKPTEPDRANATSITTEEASAVLRRCREATSVRAVEMTDQCRDIFTDDEWYTFAQILEHGIRQQTIKPVMECDTKRWQEQSRPEIPKDTSTTPSYKPYVIEKSHLTARHVFFLVPFLFT